jgi:hypothetical protein
LLTSLIRAGEGTLSGLQRSLVGVLGGAGFVNTEIERRLAHLRDTGKLNDQEVQRLRTLLVDEYQSTTAPDLPSKSDIDRLHEQVDELTRLVEQLLAQRKQ